MTTDVIDWPADGLIPCVIQDDDTNAVLMVGHMNDVALERTRATGEVHFWSRSRDQLWHKGATSGHVQTVRSMAINCDRNSLLVRVQQTGAVCHDGYATCYYRDLLPDGSLENNQERMFDPRDVYGDGRGLSGLTQRWWGAYAYLADHDLGDVSSTSATLHTPGANVLHRIPDELMELAGVLDGTHAHADQRSDMLLEGSQCCYWIIVESLLRGYGWDDVRPDRALDVTEASLDPALSAKLLRGEANALQSFNAGTASHLLHLVAQGARAVGIEPRALIEHDLADLEQRPYLAPYFAR